MKAPILKSQFPTNAQMSQAQMVFGACSLVITTEGSL
jgi:hypothetical protein